MALTILKAIKKDISVKNMIHQRLAGWEPARPHTTLHASDLMKDLEFCPREHALLDLGCGKKKDSYVGTSLRITFDHGKDIEWRIRNDWLRDIAVGYWACVNCHTRYHTFGKAPMVPCNCGVKKWEYDEPRFYSEKTGVSGGVDVLLEVGESKLRLVEIKTMDKDDHKKLVAPLAEHKFRTALYLKLIAESSEQFADRINTKEANLLYMSKSYGFKDETLKAAGVHDSPFSPFKEFIIARDDTIATVPLNKATVLQAWRTDNTVGMPCGICPNGLNGRAQKCSTNAACWGGSHPNVITWEEHGKPRHAGKKVLP